MIDLSTEAFAEFMNDQSPIRTAVKRIFRKGDVIEVRAWDKNHHVYTGRYKYGTALVAAIELFDKNECDVYYVLNPVGMNHGLRTMQQGGQCTWEHDVPWRRWFLLDFDPKRDEKVATEEQFGLAFRQALKAYNWLEAQGVEGIVFASSGNGCHLDVPCNLPNDDPSKEIVRKMQRCVSEKFSTPEVECECFPDANRLVRAYGTINKKGNENVRAYRVSGVLA
jgi:hypothetical protein